MIHYSNSATVPSLINPSFCALAELNNNATTFDVSMKVSCITIYSEGDIGLNIGILNSISNKVNIAANIVTNILTLRNKSTFAGIDNRVTVRLLLISYATEGNKSVEFSVLKNIDTTGLTFTNISVNTSVVEYATNGITVSTGKKVLSLYAGKSFSNNLNLLVYEIEINPGETLSVTGISSSTNETGISLTWRELF